VACGLLFPRRMTAVPYARGGRTVPIGRPATLELPARVYRALLTGILFESERTFLLPSVIPGLVRLKRFYDAHPGLALLVVGHTDAEGPADYNWALSCERAESVAAFLRDDAAAWLERYGPSAYGAKSWGTREDQHMLSATSDARGPFYRGPIDGAATTAATKEAIHRFQEAVGLGPTGVADRPTRQALVERYQARDETTLPAGTVLATHGCGEWHPVVATSDGVGNAHNRRVEIFLFEDGIEPPPPKRCPWGGCKEYPRWLARIARTINLLEDPPEDDDVATMRILWDHDDRPVAGLEVLVEHPDGTRRIHETDRAGEIHLAGDKSQRFRLVSISDPAAGPLVATASKAKF